MPRFVYHSSRSASQCSNQLLGFVRRHEELHLHLLELARAEDEVARSDLVAEGLAHLRDPERRLLARELQHVLEVDEDPLRRLRAQVGDRARLLHRADRRLEHQVEVARLRQVALLGFARVLGRFAPALELLQVVGAVALPARPAVHQRVGEARQMARGLPHARVLQDRRVDRHDVVALGDHRAPPLVLDVRLEQHAVVAEVVRRADAAVDLRGGKHEAAPLAQRDDLLHRHDVVWGWDICVAHALVPARASQSAARAPLAGAPAVGMVRGDHR